MEWVLGVGSFIIFLCFQAQGIVGGDSGDVVTAAVTGGVPHPPGYPLYTFFGFLLNKLPLFTPAWRVGLLSSLPHAFTLALVFAIVYSLTRRKLAATFASLVLLGNYLFFLYSVTPEVFALLDLFVATVFYLAVRFYQTKKAKYLYILVFVFGLSLTHHPLILFFAPALMLLLWNRRNLVFGKKDGIRMVVLCLQSFAAGLVPWAYIPVAARGTSIINWDHAVTLTNFIRLVTRADYGTFVSSSVFGSSVISRLLNTQAYGQYVMIDFSYIGILLILLGGMYLFRKDRHIAFAWILGVLCLGPIFYFYASFPLVGRFTLGTYERFLLPSYVLFAVMTGIGFFAVETYLSILLKKVFSQKQLQIFILFVSLVLFIYPVIFCAVTFWKFWGLPGDRTGDNLGVDILQSVPNNALLILANDTPLFTTQYLRYALGVRPDVIVVHYNLLSFPDYRAIVKHNFPSIIIPNVKDQTFISSFLTQNAVKFLLFSNVQITLPDGWYWVPHGLVYQLYTKDSLPSISSMQGTNEALWMTYHNPKQGILSRYVHLMLSDVPNTYARARLNFGETMLRAGDTDAARKQFEWVIALNSDTQNAQAYTDLGLSFLLDKECSKALDAFSHAKGIFNVGSEVVLYEGITYRDCVGDAAKAKVLLDQYAKSQKSGQTPLEKL